MFFFLRLLSLPGAAFSSSWFNVLEDQYSCSEVRLLGFVGWLYTCVMVFRHFNSSVMSMDVVKS